MLTLFHPAYPKSHLDVLNLSLLGFQLLLFYLLPRTACKVLFLFYFAFWRAAYDAGLGWVLTKQSKKKWIVREIQRLGWLDQERKPAMRSWIRAQLAGKMGKDYSFDVGASGWDDSVLIIVVSFHLGASIGVQYVALVQTAGRRYSLKVRSALCGWSCACADARGRVQRLPGVLYVCLFLLPSSGRTFVQCPCHAVCNRF